MKIRAEKLAPALMEEQLFPPSRDAALARLAAFIPHAAGDYARLRNHDLPDHPHVSRLSPYLRHRVLTEREVLEAVLKRWSPAEAEKFVQEVIWRSYFKGWLELRPSIWSEYRTGVNAAWNRVQTEGGLRSAWETACKGETGIAAFDHWARELAETGYLHNHARMWFASIWIFTLELPWELGADFFLRHLLDGDPASNTLGWRWVAGLHTIGKNYIATPDNIQKFTGGRFPLARLSTNHDPLPGSPHPEPIPLRGTLAPVRGLRTGMLMTEDDLSFSILTQDPNVRSVMVVDGTRGRSPLQVSEKVARMSKALTADAVERYASEVDAMSFASNDNALAEWVEREAIEQIIAPYMTQGPANDWLRPQITKLEQSGLRFVEQCCDYDRKIWPLCTAGFFKVKKAIPGLLGELGLHQSRDTTRVSTTSA